LEDLGKVRINISLLPQGDRGFLSDLGKINPKRKHPTELRLNEYFTPG